MYMYYISWLLLNNMIWYMEACGIYIIFIRYTIKYYLKIYMQNINYSHIFKTCWNKNQFLLLREDSHDLQISYFIWLYFQCISQSSWHADILERINSWVSSSLRGAWVLISFISCTAFPHSHLGDNELFKQFWM